MNEEGGMFMGHQIRRGRLLGDYKVLTSHVKILIYLPKSKFMLRRVTD